MNTQEEYLIIEDLVKDFQQGNRETGEKIIEHFFPFTLKYMQLIKYGIMNYHDKDIRFFIAMFVADPFIRTMIRYGKRKPADGEVAAYNTVNVIKETCKSLEECDLTQEMALIILIMATRYRPKGKSNFCGYMYNVFKYELYRKLVKITKDPITYSTTLEDYTKDEDFTQNESLYIISPNVVNLESALDYNWVHGITCSDAFSELTELERLLLKLTYEDHLTDIEISEKVGLHRHTIRKKKIACLKKVDIFKEQWYNN